MKNIKMAEAAARYGMTMSGLEELLVELGWMAGGQWLPGPFERALVTVEREVTQRGLGYLDGYLWRR